jgi:hypothetical protein
MKKFQELFAFHRSHDTKAANFSRKRLATAAVALQRMIVEKAYARAGVDVDLANKLKRQIQSRFTRNLL